MMMMACLLWSPRHMRMQSVPPLFSLLGCTKDIQPLLDMLHVHCLFSLPSHSHEALMLGRTPPSYNHKPDTVFESIFLYSFLGWDLTPSAMPLGDLREKLRPKERVFARVQQTESRSLTDFNCFSSWGSWLPVVRHTEHIGGVIGHERAQVEAE